MTTQPPTGGTVPGPFDALIPAAIARRAEEVGQAKARMDAGTVLALAVLAGAFIALGALFFTTVTTGAAGVTPYGAARLLGGLAFCLGLVLVVLAGAELFTGNNLIVMAWIGGSVSTGQLLRNWALVYAGNLVGSLATVALVYLSGQFRFAGGAVGAQALAIANAKVSLGFWEPLFLGMLCNALVCLAIWLTMGAHSTTDKVIAILFPITAFVAIGFEHSVANMYFVPIGLLIKSDGAFLASLGKTAADYAGLTWGAFLVENLVPVTLGNIIGGAGLVGAVYWFIYLRKPAAR